MEKHTVSRLIGAPPGYVGFDQGGLLTDAIRKTPYAVLLLDEIEKAHPDIYNILLQVMDHATLTDNNGRKADFRHIVLIMTTNAGARELSARRLGFGADAQRPPATRARRHRATFSPEFRNRLDALDRLRVAAAGGHPQGRRQARRRARRSARGEEGHARADAGRRASWLAEHGFDKSFGARPMARLIQNEAEEAARRARDPVRRAEGRRPGAARGARRRAPPRGVGGASPRHAADRARARLRSQGSFAKKGEVRLDLALR